MTPTIIKTKSSRVGSRNYKRPKVTKHPTLQAAIEFAMRKKYRIVETVSTPRGDRLNVVDKSGKQPKAITLSVVTQDDNSGGVV